MTTNPNEPLPEPEVVPSGDPAPIDPGEVPGTEPEPEPDLQPEPVGKTGPIDVEGVPSEEGISIADAAERVGLDPDEQLNRPDQPGASPEERQQFDSPGAQSIADSVHPEDR